MSTESRTRRLRDLGVVLVGRDLRVAYGGAWLGLFWAPVTIVLQVVVLTFVFDRVVPLGIDDYPAFLFTGIAAWHLVSSAIIQASEAFTGNRDLVRRPGFPDVVLPLVTLGRALAAYALGLPMLAAVLLVSGRLGVEVVALPIVLSVAALVIAGPAFLVASLQVRYRDTLHLVRVLFGALFYATPVFYPQDRLPDRFEWVADANPFAGVVSLHRQVLYEGSWPDLRVLAVTAAFGGVGVLAGTAAFRRAGPGLADDL